MDQIISTKLFIPPARQETVHRPHLFRKLNAGLSNQLTLLSAPAGFGKTTLAVAWAKGTGRPVAWFSLDESDNDFSRFITYLVAALQGAIHAKGTFGEKTLQLQANSQNLPPDILLTALINDISEQARPLILVLDDYHVIDNARIDEALQFLLQHQPPQLHLVITTREDPQLPLARLRARGQLSELRAADLRFSEEEAGALFNDILHLGLTNENITTLEKRTEGWITGLQLAGIALSGNQDADGFISSFSGRHRFVLSYLIEEVLEQQSENVQQFLLKTSILERLNGPLCNALTGQDDGQAMLEWLEKANLFLVPLDEEQKWYRYHHLFADLLRQRIASRQPDSVAELHRKASIWHEENGLSLEAFQHAAAANDIDRAARLMDGEGVPLHFRGGMFSVMQWLSCLSSEILDTRPALRVTYASTLTMLGRPIEQIEEVLAAAERSLQAAHHESTRDLIGQIAATRSMLAIPKDDIPAVIHYSKIALENLAEDNVSSRTSMAWTQGYAYQRQGERVAALKAFSEAISVSQAAGNTFMELASHISLGQVLESNNQLHQAAVHYRKAQELAGNPPVPVACEALIGLARLEYEWNRIENAARYAQESAVLAQQLPNVDTPVTIEMLNARIKMAEGDHAGSMKALSKAEDYATNNHFRHHLPEIAAARARVLLQSGKASEAKAALGEDVQPEAQVRIFLAENSPGQARTILIELQQSFEEKGWAHELLQTRLLQAITEQLQKNTALAGEYLKVAIQMAGPSGYLRLFVDEGAEMERLIKEVSRENPTEYIQQVMDAFGTPPISASTASGGSEPLSEREIEVLRLLNTNLTGPEIARELMVSLNTMRTHTKNIYRKLDVSSRRAAVRKASDLKLL